MTSVAEDTALAFLRTVPPFDLLDEATLRRVVQSAELQFFPKGTQLLRQGGSPSGYLFVIERGGIERSMTAETGEPILVDVLGDGELVGILSTIEQDAARFNVIAVEDTLCYAIPRAVVDELMATHPRIAQYFVRFSIEQYLDRSLDALRHGTGIMGATVPLLYSTPLRSLASRPLLTCRADDSIREAAAAMSERRMSSIVVLDDAGQAAGIVTDRDLRTRVVAVGRALDEPVAAIMSKLTLTINADEPLTEALRLMVTGNVNHLVVTEEGRPFGMVTSRDLILAQGSSALSIAREIERQTDTAGLRQALERSQRIVPYLLAQGVRARTIGHIMAAINDRAVVRVLEMVEQELGPPPVPYCWIVTGSEGRQEQTFRTDQDNAIIYADPTPEAAESVRQYFLAFGQRAVETLVAVGFPPCSGHYTADNPEWAQPLSGWFGHFEAWIGEAEPQRLLHALIFFDFRGIHGGLELADRLRAYVTELMLRSNRFLIHLAKVSTYQQPPIGFLRHFIVERSGEHRDELNLKFHGSGLVVNLARFYALRGGITETNTIGRLEQAAARGMITNETAQSLAQAYEFLLDLRIRQQAEQLQAGETPSNYVNPKRLAPLDRTMLREAFSIIAREQNLIREAYHTSLLPD